MTADPFPWMIELLPERRLGRAEVQHRDGRALLSIGGVEYMSDALYEREHPDNLEAVRWARGRVLVGGLGLGMVLHPIAAKPEVTEVVVVEREPDVIALVAPTLPAKVRIVLADVEEWRPPVGERFDTIFLDVLPATPARRTCWDAVLAELIPWLAPGGWARAWARPENPKAVKGGCKCAKRMREHVLPGAGYRREGDQWIGPEGDRIYDSEVEAHHTRLVLTNQKLRSAAGRAVAKTLLDRLSSKRDPE